MSKHDPQWFERFCRDNLREAEAIDAYLDNKPLAWKLKVDILAAPVIERGNKVARRYRAREHK